MIAEGLGAEDCVLEEGFVFGFAEFPTEALEFERPEVEF